MLLTLADAHNYAALLLCPFSGQRSNFLPLSLLFLSLCSILPARSRKSSTSHVINEHLSGIGITGAIDAEHEGTLEVFFASRNSSFDDQVMAVHERGKLRGLRPRYMPDQLSMNIENLDCIP